MEISSILQKLPRGHAINRAKDRLLAKGAKAQINRLIGRYGTMLDIRLNAADRSLFVSLLLKGEQAPIEIRIHEYALVNSEGKTYLEIDGGNVDTSREWLTQLIRDRLGRQRLVVPPDLAWLVQLLG
jgi:hypothetical protein